MATHYDGSLRHGGDFDFRLDGKVAVVTGGLGQPPTILPRH